MKIKPPTGKRLIENFCARVEAGETPDQYTLQTLAKMLRASFNDADSIGPDDLKHAEKIGRKVVANLGFTAKKGRKTLGYDTVDGWNALEQSKEFLAAKYYWQLRDNGAKPKAAKTETLDKFAWCAERTLERYAKTYRQAAKIKLRIDELIEQINKELAAK